MIGAQAGVRHVERVPAYLNNLFRLGLIWFSREPVADRLRYQVLEAQPDVVRRDERGRPRQDDPPQHRADALRPGLLHDLPAAQRSPPTPNLHKSTSKRHPTR